MSTEEERARIVAARLKDSRVLIVSNLLNGLPAWQIAQSFHTDVKEIDAIFKFVTNKVKNYLFRLCKPPIACDTVEQAKRDRINLLAILPKLNLDSRAEFANIVSETLTANNCKSIVNDILR
jgi:hypothetical protein